MWFQNRRAKWRKQEHTRKGPGRPAHNAHPQTCSGEPLSEEEIRHRAEEKLQRKMKMQEEKLKRLKNKRNVLTNIQCESLSTSTSCDSVEDMQRHDNSNSNTLETSKAGSQENIEAITTNGECKDDMSKDTTLNKDKEITKQMKQLSDITYVTQENGKRNRNPFSIESLLDSSREIIDQTEKVNIIDDFDND